MSIFRERIGETICLTAVRGVILGLALAAYAGGGTAAWANTLFLPEASAYAAGEFPDLEAGGGGLPPQTGFLNYPELGSGCAAAVGNGFGSVCGIAANPTGPAIAATVSGEVMDAEASLNYSVQIIGPTGATVPVIIGGDVATVAAPSDEESAIAAGASLDVVDSDLLPNLSGILIEADACSSIYQEVTETCSYPSDVLINSIVPVRSDDILDVSIQAAVSVEYGTSFGNFSSSFADPSFEVDPTFALANEFSFVLSPGIGNPAPPTPAVPEPASLALLGTGLAGFAARRRRG